MHITPIERIPALVVRKIERPAEWRGTVGAVLVVASNGKYRVVAQKLAVIPEELLVVLGIARARIRKITDVQQEIEGHRPHLLGERPLVVGRVPRVANHHETREPFLGRRAKADTT